MPEDEEWVELRRPPTATAMDEEETAVEAGPSTVNLNNDIPEFYDDLAAEEDAVVNGNESALNRRTRRKLDGILLPFLALLFLLNSLDKSNIGNAETAGFTRDAGLSAKDLNISLGFFFAFFVALQPVGAACGRKYGMARWVPACMSLWGLCTLLHIWVRRRWQLILLRIAIATLEAGFYPTTVSYLSLFYTRYEFAVRLGFFYGQTAVAGVLGGILSWAVFSQFSGTSTPSPSPEVADSAGWRSWEVLFLIEGCMTIVIALTGFFWLPHSADTAWFFNERERQWAERRIRLDRNISSNVGPKLESKKGSRKMLNDEGNAEESRRDDDADGDVHHRLLHQAEDSEVIRERRKTFAAGGVSITADTGLTWQDVLSAFLNYKIWHLLICNILSAIPATSFGVFMPLVVKQLSPSLNLSPAASNLLAAPPFAFGAVVLFGFTRWSDRSKLRVVPILCGMVLLLIGLTATILIPMDQYILRYSALCILLSGSFIASPLTVAWLTNNTPEPGKRAILLGINGWGNLAGVFLVVLFTPEDRESGYIRPMIITLFCALASFAGFAAFWVLLVRENKWRMDIITNWSQEERDREELAGDLPIPHTIFTQLQRRLRFDAVAQKLGKDEDRRGDEKVTFRYGL